MSSSELFKKYDIPAPRYTSYPTVPYWSDNPTTEQWMTSVKETFADPKASWSLYIHIPYCETLCTFCGCNTTITKDHNREEPYVQLIHREWETYLKAVPEMAKRPLVQFHLGGGTPTFLSPANLRKLIEPIFKAVQKDAQHFEGSIEVDPRRTTREQLAVLKELGFTRVSMGVQDFNPEVQRLVNRKQPREMTEALVNDARELGYGSVNFDLIYGLPKQTEESIREMAEITCEMLPDRIALYSFAKVPWIKPAQRLFKDEDLPEGEDKRRLYEIARGILLEAGYREIGMDHFALPNDSLSKSEEEGHLHRNFMGYADRRTEALIGLGVSSISETPGCFHQNEKVLPIYERRVMAGEIPTLRGHLLSDEDRKRREQILAFMTRWQVELESDAQAMDVRQFLSSLIADGLVQLNGRKMTLTEKGRPFLRNACMALDARLRAKAPDTKVFSSSL
ncbi:MAG TPA: oxygen-independent coproporphyrinogen III oxidase [Bdellovibrionales bacterium]|nr:oxygen-independent coproporphyrinogen III oxidase [Bdellovibrionales bacterium]